jgi:MFS family permease
MVAAGTAGIQFCTMGYTNSFGVFQAYYMSHQLRDETLDRIAWIGALMSFLVFAASAVGGPLFDRFGAKVIYPAAILYVLAVMMTSLCTTYYSVSIFPSAIGKTTPPREDPAIASPMAAPRFLLKYCGMADKAGNTRQFRAPPGLHFGRASEYAQNSSGVG